ncbi:MAG TPA: hypothetical protein VOA87_22290 [Thermoanaerobaculia bacterium]|nr:hypothetical protein [Thermoanaerobaculia bacterium]
MIGALSLAVSFAILAPAGSPPASAHSCDSWTRQTDSLVRFRGTIRAVEPLGAAETTASLVGRHDQRFVVKIAVESVEPNADVRQGAILNLAIHSPAESLGSDADVGTTLDLELVSEYCDGAFWRFMELRPRSSASPQQFEGYLGLGKTFRVPVEWDPAEKATGLSEELHVPMHYGGEIEWVNPEAIRGLGPDRPRGYWVLEVRSVEAESLGDNKYWVTYKCAFLSLEPCPPCTAPK